MRRLISMILMASSFGTGRLRKMFTLPWTKLSMMSFAPVSCSYRWSTSTTSLFGNWRVTVLSGSGVKPGIEGGGAAFVCAGVCGFEVPGAVEAGGTTGALVGSGRGLTLGALV